MLVLPALDLMGGRCVRLRRGQAAAVTVYDHDPVSVARRWVRQGARTLHVVDLDGAFAGRPLNTETVAAVAAAAGVPVQAGGGLRTAAAVSALLEHGVRRVILSTAVLRDMTVLQGLRDRWGDRVVVSLDLRGDVLRVSGWNEAVAPLLDEVLAELAARGVSTCIVTDTGRDGTLEGIDPAPFARVADHGLRVIAAGGVRDVADIRRLAAVPGLCGVIIGRALYEGTITLAAALETAGDTAAMGGTAQAGEGEGCSTEVRDIAATGGEDCGRET